MRSRLRIPWAMTLCLCLFVAVAPAPRAGAMEAEDCQGCHSDRSIIESGGARLYIDPVKYAHTTHAEEGCPSCHSSVTDSHPDDGLRPSKASCSDCHDDVEAEYAKTAHAANAVCTDCHNPHAVKNPQAVSGVDVNRQCANCHDRATVLSAHSAWLPQTSLHLEALPCVTCHSASKEYVITLYFERRPDRSAREGEFQLAGYRELSQIAPNRDIAGLVDGNRDGKIALAELRKFHRGSDRLNLRLWGMMMPEHVTHSFVTLDNRWDCSFCHASGPTALQTAFLAIPEEDGSYRRLPVEKGAVLDLLYGTPDFYMMGASRNDNLSRLGLAIILAGLIMPLGHGTLRFLTRHNRKEH